VLKETVQILDQVIKCVVVNYVIHKASENIVKLIVANIILLSISMRLFVVGFTVKLSHYRK